MSEHDANVHKDLSPSLWGDDMWIGMYSIAFGYPEKPSPAHIQAAINYFKSLELLLPCSGCRVGYCELLQKHSIERSVRSNPELCKWVNRIHNEVNVKLNKQPITISQMRLYFSERTSNPLQSAPRAIPIKRKRCRKCEQQS